MATATVASSPALEADRRIVLHHVSWETYERLLADDEERRVPRLTYDRGVLEIVSPSAEHEKDGHLVMVLVEIVAAFSSTRILNVGSTTYRRQDLARGFEADASFYIQHEPSVRDREHIDLDVDPPPDLVIETEVSRSAVDKLALFAQMGVPEVWRSSGRAVTILVLDGGSYRDADTSAALPMLTRHIVNGFLADGVTRPRHEWIVGLSEWARTAQRPSAAAG